MSQTSNAQPAPDRHAEGNSAVGVALSGCTEPLLSRIPRPAGVISPPGPAGRPRSPATAAGLSDWLFFLGLACCSPLPSGPLPPMPFVLRYPCTAAAAAVAPLAG